jgi:hypothetical protein
VRSRWIRVLTATSAVAVLCATVGVTGSAAAASSGSDATATCTFNGSGSPLIEGVKAKKVIAIQCAGLPADHPYLVVEVSLLAAINPQAAAALSGGITSPTGLLGAVAAVPDINLQSEATPLSDSNGNLTENWTVPSSQPLDPNGTCPPSKEQFDSGLLGCAIAMIDLTSGGPVGAGSGLMEYKGFSELPPPPSMALSTTSASPGQTVSVSDVVMKKASKDTYWWLPTLISLAALLGSSGGPPTINLTVGGVPVDSSGISIVGASYNGTTFTPPKLSGSFTVPPGLSGPQVVSVAFETNILGLELGNGASANLNITS